MGVVSQSLAAHPVAQVDQGRQVAAVPGRRNVHGAAGRRLHASVRDQPSAAHQGANSSPPRPPAALNWALTARNVLNSQESSASRTKRDAGEREPVGKASLLTGKNKVLVSSDRLESANQR